MSADDVLGNYWADQEAGDVVRGFDVPMNVSSGYLYYYHIAKKIQKRVSTIITHLPNRPKHIPKIRQKSEKLSSLASNSSHFIYAHGVDDKILSCARCNMSYHKDDRGIRQWLQGFCPGEQSKQDRPVPVLYENIHIGRQDIHHSHQLYFYSGIYYCNVCGCRASQKAKNLALGCEPPKEAGLAFKRAVDRGGALPEYFKAHGQPQFSDSDRRQRIASSTHQTLVNAAEGHDKHSNQLYNLAQSFASLAQPVSPESNVAECHGTDTFDISTPRPEPEPSRQDMSTMYHLLYDDDVVEDSDSD